MNISGYYKMSIFINFIKNYFYIKQMINTDLGSEWTKEFDKNGELVYYNHVTDVCSKSHPLIKKFRIIFNDY